MVQDSTGGAMIPELAYHELAELADHDVLSSLSKQKVNFNKYEEVLGSFSFYLELQQDLGITAARILLWSYVVVCECECSVSRFRVWGALALGSREQS
jgi:hypothetical protein